jgi:hypothetical protein
MDDPLPHSENGEANDFQTGSSPTRRGEQELLDTYRKNQIAVSSIASSVPLINRI